MENTFWPQMGEYIFKTIFNEILKEKKNQDLEIAVKMTPESSAD